LDNAILQIFKPLKMVFCSSYDGVPLKFKKKKRAGLQSTSTDYLSLLLSPLRIRWTISLTTLFKNTKNSPGVLTRGEKSPSFCIVTNTTMDKILPALQLKEGPATLQQDTHEQMTE
jgi:hypothetical protein